MEEEVPAMSGQLVHKSENSHALVHDVHKPVHVYTLEQVSEAVNAGADTVYEGLCLGDRDYDLINLIVKSIVITFEKPGISLDEVIIENYGCDPEEVRGWWDWS